MVYYKSVKVTIDAPGLAKVIIDIVVRYHDLLNYIISDYRAILYQSSSLCSVTLSVSKDGTLLYSTLRQTGRQNNKIVR